MVQLQPNTSLTLKNLAGQGAVVSAEQQAALDHSLPIKRVEAGLKNLTLWGKITTLNGKDFLVAEGYNDPTLLNGKVTVEAKYYYSQDAVKWVDLVPVDQDTAARAGKVRTQLSGDPAKIYELEEKDPNAPEQPPAAEEGAEEPEPPKPLVFQIPELAVLWQRIDAINQMTGVVPVHSMQPDAFNRMVSNRLFPGVSYPEKLESYMHRTIGPGGPTLAQDLRGSWSIQYDPFKQVAVCRSMVYPGYFFYYHAVEMTWGAMYVGDGVRNDDLIFML